MPVMMVSLALSVSACTAPSQSSSTPSAHSPEGGLAQDLQNELIKGSRPVVPLSGVVVRDGCAAATAQEHDTCMDFVFPRMAWVASVEDIINAIRG
jgi:hypothetical protein